MKRAISMGLMAVATAALFGVATPVFATSVTQTIDVRTVFTGATPNGTAPWLTATFMYNNDGSSNMGTLTLQSNLTDGNLLQGGSGKGNGVMGWGFNLAGNGLTSWSCTSGTCANKVSQTVNSGPVGNSFNLGFGWTSHNRFGGSDTETFTLTFANTLTTSPFTANGDGFLAFAHVRGITGGNTNSAFIVNGNGSPIHPVPEPGTLGMFGLGALVLGAFVGLRRRFS